MKKLYLVGQRFARLLVLSSGSVQNGKTTSVCLCDCGNTSTIVNSDLRSGHTKSCGCFQQETRLATNITHGQSRIGSRTYDAWLNMKRRCLDPSNKYFANYGGRGITVCQQWQDSFEKFFTDMGECPPNLTIERLNNAKGYEPGNCEWITRKAQNRNKRNNHVLTVRGVTGCLKELSERFSVSNKLVSGRLRRGYSAEDAFFAPKSKPGPKSKIVWQQIPLNI